MQKLRYNNPPSPLYQGGDNPPSPLYQGGELAEGFILFLKSRTDTGKMQTNAESAKTKHPSGENETRDVNNSALKQMDGAEAADDKANELKAGEVVKKINLNEALNKALFEINETEDAEEEMVSKWKKNIKIAQAEMAPTTGPKKGKSGNIKFYFDKSGLELLPKEKKPQLLFAPLAKLSLPAGVIASVLAAFLVSVFFNISAPAGIGKIVAFTDKIYEIPKEKFYKLAYLPEYRIDKEFYKKADEMIAGNVNLKSRFIERNQETLSGAQNKSKFLITKDELLGLPAYAGPSGWPKKEKSWPEKIDTVIWLWSNSAQKLFAVITDKINK